MGSIAAFAEPRLPLSLRLVGGVEAETPSEELSSSLAPATMIFDNAEESEDEERVIVAGSGAMMAVYTEEGPMQLVSGDTTRSTTRGGAMDLLILASG
jgi:hypothetical protein